MPEPADPMAPWILDTPTSDRYPCSRTGCGYPCVEVEAVPFNRNGMDSSIAFYGHCEDHRTTPEEASDV